MFDFLKPHHGSSLSFTVPTALILLDNQAAFAHPATGKTPSRSNPLFEVNLTSLLGAFRAARESVSEKSDSHNHGTGKGEKKQHLEIVHIFHVAEDNPRSPLHPQHPGNGIRPLDFAQPVYNGDENTANLNECVIWKSINSAPPIGPDLQNYLRSHGIKQLLFAGLTTDHAVSTTVRTAANLGLVEPGGVLLVGDATATWARAGIEAETVHAVSVASLEGEFARVVRTEDVVRALRR